MRQVLRAGGLLTILDDASLIDNEDSTRGGIPYPGQHREDDIVFLDHFLVQVAGQRDADLLLLRPRFLCKWRIDTNCDDIRVKAAIGAQTTADVAHLLRADAGESGGEKQQRSEER